MQILSRPGTDSERRELVLTHGYNAMAFLTLYPGWEYFHPAEGQGFIAFERHCGAALAVGDPVCAAGDEAALVEAFRRYCLDKHLTPAFVGASARLAEEAHDNGWMALKVGEEPIFEVANYALSGHRAKKVRWTAKKARTDGVTVEAFGPGGYPSPVITTEMTSVQEAWLGSRKMSALSYTLRLTPLVEVDKKIVLLARFDGRLEGFATCVPIAARNCWYVEHIIRRPDAASGVSELLFLGAIGAIRENGGELANLGLAPLRNTRAQAHGHRVSGHVLQAMFNRPNLFYKIKPLEHFKSKFGPARWEDAYLVYRPRRLGRVGVAIMSAFAPGRLGPVRAGISRFWRPVPKVRRSHGHVPGGQLAGAAAGVAIVGAYTALAVMHPGVIAPLHVASLAVTAPAKEADEVVRAHLIIDLLLAAGLGGLWVRSVRGG